MHVLIRNIFGVLIGLILGGIINMSIILLGADLVPPPEGVNVQDPESIAAGMHLFEPKHFVVPFLAHALGTFFGALIAFLVAGSGKPVMALIVGVAFLAGGIMMVMQVPSPLWFNIVDLGLAYLPMAGLAILIGRRVQAPAESPA